MENLGKLPIKLLTTPEVAELLHIHINTVRKWSDRGILKSYRIGPRHERRFSILDIAEYLISVRHAPKPAESCDAESVEAR